MAEEFYLDWEKDTLQVWEMGKSDLIIASMIEGIKLGCDFPTVEVVRLDNNSYRLTPGNLKSNGFSEWGHHRAVAHYMEGAPLRCRLLKEPFGIDPNNFGYVENIVVCDHENIWNDTLLDSLEKLPLDVAKRFCLENDLNSDYFSL